LSARQLLLEWENRASEPTPALWLVGLNPGVLEGVRRSRLADRLGSERLLYNARAAIERFLAEEEKTGGTPGQPPGRVAMRKRRRSAVTHRPAATARSDQLNPTT
jgi:hypothetical protein